MVLPLVAFQEQFQGLHKSVVSLYLMCFPYEHTSCENKNSIISAGHILTFGLNSLASEYMTLSIGGGITGLLCNGTDPRSAYMISPRLVTCENNDECGNHECILYLIHWRGRRWVWRRYRVIIIRCC